MRFLQRAAKPPLLAMVHQTNPPRYSFVGEDSADLAFDPALLPPDWLLHAEWDVHLRFAVATGTAACLEAGAVPPTLASVQKLLTRM